MKNYFSKIFAVYILSLALIPCSDSNATVSCYAGEKHNAEASHSGQEHCNDMCTPLCICVCCNDVTTVCDKFIFKNSNNYTTLDLSEYLHSSFHYIDSSSPPPKS